MRCSFHAVLELSSTLGKHFPFSMPKIPFSVGVSLRWFPWTRFSVLITETALVNILMFLCHIMYLLAIINVVECNFSSNIWLKEVCIA